MENFDRESRLWAIAINAIREAKIATGRADDPYSDDDSLRVTSIFQLLHVKDMLVPEVEHFPLVKKDKVTEKVARVAAALKELPDELRQSEAAHNHGGGSNKAA